MKAVICFALLAFVASATFNPIEFYRGAVSNLPLATEQKNQIMNDGLACLQGSTHILASFIHVVQQNFQHLNIENLGRDLMFLGHALEAEVEPKCLNVFQTIHTLIAQYNSSAPRYHYDNIMHQSIMIKLAGETFMSLAQGQSFAAGEKLGLIFEIYTGMFKPTLPKTEELSFEKWAKYEEERFIIQFSTELAKTLGLKDSANMTAQCVSNVVHTFKQFHNSSDLHSHNTAVKLHALLDAFNTIQGLVKAPECHAAMTVINRIAAPFAHYPFQALARLVFNFVMENPTLLQQYMNFVIYAIHGEYELSGQAAGNDIITLLRGIAF